MGELGKFYICLSRFMVNPMEVSREELEGCLSFFSSSSGDGEIGGLFSRAAGVALEILSLIASRSLESHYISLFELSPKCPPYIGYYAFEDERARRLFMVNMAQWYKRFGLGMRGGELPDYIPAIVEFMGLTAGVRSAERGEFVARFVKPYLPPFLECVKKYSDIYYRLYKVFEDLLDLEFPKSRVVVYGELG